MTKRVLLFLSLCLPAFAAAVFRVDPSPAMTTAGNAPTGGFPALYAVPSAQVTLCADSACASFATAYQDSTGLVTCPAQSPVTLPGVTPPTCTAFAGAQGQFGFWLPAGLYYYKLTLASGVAFGPFPLSSNGSSSQFPGGGSQSQVLEIQPNSGNITTYQWASRPPLNLSDYAYAPIQPTGTLAGGGGAQPITLGICPLGIFSGGVWSSVYLSGGTGTAEALTPTGGSCATATLGIQGGTIIVSPTFSHSGAYTAQSATAGIQEAEITAVAASGGTILIPPGTYTMHATVMVTASGIHFMGAGRSTTTIYRTEDYGHTFQVGTAAVGSINDIQFIDLTMTYDMGASFGACPGATCGQILSITRHPTVFPNSAHIYGYGLIYFRLIRCRLNDMPYGLVSMGGAYSSVFESQFQGLWDYTSAALQVTKASMYLTGDATPHGSTQGFYTINSDFFGFNSPARNVTINGVVLNFSENIGPQYMIQADYAEVMQYVGGLNGGGGIGVYLNPVTNGLSGITITGVHFDGNRLAAGMLIDNANSASGNVINVEFTGNDCQGSGNSNACIVVNSSAGIRPVSAMSITGNMFSTFNASAISLLDGVQISIGGGQTFRNFNFRGAYNGSNKTIGGSAINIGGNAALVGIAGGNVYCGGTNDIYGVTVDNSDKIAILPGRNAGVCAGVPPDLAFGGILPGAIYSVGGWNYIASETGGSLNNAIAANVTGFNGLSDGACYYLNLAHSLQAGANTIALNGGAAVPLKSHLNTALNIASAYTAGGSFLHVCYKSSANVFLDMGQ